MKQYSIVINGEFKLLKDFEDETECRHYCINYLDMSDTITFSEANYVGFNELCLNDQYDENIIPDDEKEYEVYYILHCDKFIFFGGMANIGFLIDKVYPYDNDFSLDQNLQETIEEYQDYLINEFNSKLVTK